jgi:glycosyltransferase involved in cell wall biosynthesis
MRILVANWTRRTAGGAERYLQALLPALARRGHALALLAERDESDAGLRIDAPRGGVALLGAGLAAGEAADAARGWRPDVVFVHGLESSDLERRLVDGHAAALFTHGYYGTCISGTKRHAFPFPEACRRPLGPACLLLYFPRRCGGLDPRTMMREYERQQARRALLPRYRAVVAGSEHMRREYGAHGVERGRLHVAPMPPTTLQPDPGPPAPREMVGRLLFLGRLTALKGVAQLLLEIPLAERRLGRPLGLDVAGDGPEEASLRETARRRGVAAVFHGWVDEARRLELLRQADLLVMPSLWPEPFGLAGIEAACVGLPTAAYRLGAIPEWLEPGVSGELAPGELPTRGALAQAIAAALESDAHLQRLRVGAWERARTRTMDDHVAALERIFEAVAGAAKS